jgi:hypothetical protein
MLHLTRNSMNFANVGLMSICTSIIVSLNIIITSVGRRNIVESFLVIINIDLLAT